MNIREVLEDIKLGKISIEDGLKKLQHLPYESDIGYAKIDNNRSLTKGFPEVILGNSKEPQQVLEIAKKIFEISGKVVITKANLDLFIFIKNEMSLAEYYNEAKIIAISNEKKKTEGNIIVACAGTSDLPVAEEASVIATIMGSNVNKMYDIGIAGLHRLLNRLDDLKKSNVIVAVAGMEGALPSVIASLVDKPVIAVPTSVGYGSNLGGLTPLFSMLNSCVPGMAVVNIDNGFGAGTIAHMINQMAIKGGGK